MALSVTPETLALLKDLEHRRAWGLLPESPDRLLAILDAIQQRGEPDAAILLWAGIENRSAPVRHRTLEVMSALLNTASGSRVASLIRETARGNPIWTQADHEHW